MCIGGTAEYNVCLGDRGKRGNSGTINISSSNITITGIFDTSRADSGWCQDGQTGKTYLTYTDNLDLTGSSITRYPFISPFCDSGDTTSTCNIIWNHAIETLTNLNNLNISQNTALEFRASTTLNSVMPKPVIR